jgi:adenylate kinase family enzyme
MHHAGAGKGANMPFIRRIRGLSHSVVVSSLLTRRPETREIVESGGLVSDESVCDVLLEALFDPLFTAEAGVIVDGFPRSTSQVRGQPDSVGFGHCGLPV